MIGVSNPRSDTSVWTCEVLQNYLLDYLLRRYIHRQYVERMVIVHIHTVDTTDQ
jgi:hypothetical protein